MTGRGIILTQRLLIEILRIETAREAQQRGKSMAKRMLKDSQLERDIIETLIAGHKEWRPDLDYPESYSDMQGAVRGLLQMYEVKRRPLPAKLEYATD